jgi:lysophospholipase L1-like esterase
VLLPLVLIVVALIVFAPSDSAPEPAAQDPSPGAALKLVVLGDSYISGEGAEGYFPGTDAPGRNMCHRASTAYPYLLARDLPASLTFAACSGARTRDVLGVYPGEPRRHGQYPDSPEHVFGARPQLEVLRQSDPGLVLISIGGNDAGFAEIGASCAGPSDCRGQAQRWLRRLDTDVYPALVETYSRVRQAATAAAGGKPVPVVAFTYPNPLGKHYCRQLLGVDPAEWEFLRDDFTVRLNEIVAAAARVAGVRVIRLDDAFDGYRFCEQDLGETAVNLVKFEHTRGEPLRLPLLGGLFHGSLHPNPLGHLLLERVVLKQLRALRAGGLGPEPQPQPNPGPPPERQEVPALGGSPEFPPGTECDGRELASVTQLAADPEQRFVALAAVRPSSLVCFRDFHGEWDSKRASAKGTVQVPVDLSREGVAGINEILVEESGGAWKEVVISPLGPADEVVSPG